MPLSMFGIWMVVVWSVECPRYATLPAAGKGDGGCCWVFFGHHDCYCVCLYSVLPAIVVGHACIMEWFANFNFFCHFVLFLRGTTRPTSS
jgi:hypothetical protein